MLILCKAETEESHEISNIVLLENNEKNYSRLSSAAVVIGASRVKTELWKMLLNTSRTIVVSIKISTNVVVTSIW